MYGESRVDGELTSVIVRCEGQAPTRVTEQNRYKTRLNYMLRLDEVYLQGKGGWEKQID